MLKPDSDGSFHYMRTASARSTPRLPEILSHLADVYLAKGYAPAAEPLLGQALSIFEKVLPENHLETGKTLDKIATLHMAKGEMDKAEPLMKRIIDIYSKNFGGGSSGNSSGSE